MTSRIFVTPVIIIRKRSKPSPKPGVRHGAEASNIEIPPVVLRQQPEFIEAPFEYLQTLFPLDSRR